MKECVLFGELEFMFGEDNEEKRWSLLRLLNDEDLETGMKRRDFEMKNRARI